jgi:hypothetical protein
VRDNVGLSKNFEADWNLGGLIGSKPSKFEILDIHGSPMGEKGNPRPHPLIHGAGAGLTRK